MKPSIIADTSALISLLSKDDSLHTRANTISNIVHKNKQRIIIPGEIITELVNVLGKKASHATAIRYANIIFASNEYQIVDTTDTIRTKAFEKFAKQKENVSFTDCLVMAIADEYETKTIFGFDTCFATNGYALPEANK